MKRLARIAIVALPMMMLAAAPASADVKTRDKTTIKFEGMLGRMFNLFGGKAAKEGVEGLTALKGTRKATIGGNSGTIVDLSEEKVYDLDMKKKTYTVTTFEQLRQKMREAEENARKQAEKEPGKKEEPSKPTKEYEVDFDVKDTGQKKSIAGYDTHETVVTITMREKGKTLDEAGGMVMTNNMWLGPKIPALKELSDFELKYWRQLQGPETAAVSAEQMAQVLAMYPLIGKAMDRMAKEGDKLAGTPLDTTTTFESVLSKDQLTEAQANSASSGKGGGIGGMLARKIVKQDAPKARSTIMTTHHEVLEVTPSAAATDVAIPADFKEKK